MPFVLPVAKKVLPLALAWMCNHAWAQGAATLTDRLQQAAVATALDTEGLAPWHLKLDVQMPASRTQTASQGAIEVWWKAPETYRVQYTFPEYRAVTLRTPEGSYRTRDQDSPPALFATLLDQILHPLRLQSNTSYAPEQQSKNFGKITLDCIMLAKPLKPNADRSFKPASVPLGLFPTYCFDPGTPALRVTYSLGSQAVVRNGVGLFQKKSVSIRSSVLENGSTLATGTVQTLRSGETPPDDAFVATPDLEETGKAALVSGGVMAGTILTKAQPVYPDSAKYAHIYGTVVLAAIIGRDGHIHQLELVSAPDGDLAISAMSAVRTWTYRPYLLNGHPSEVDTTITVNFAIGSR